MVRIEKTPRKSEYEVGFVLHSPTTSCSDEELEIEETPEPEDKHILIEDKKEGEVQETVEEEPIYNDEDEDEDEDNGYEEEIMPQEEPIPPLCCRVTMCHSDGNEGGKFPAMFWEMLQELGYEKPPEYHGKEIAYEDATPVWDVEVRIFRPHPVDGVYEVEKIHQAIASRNSFANGIRDATRQAYMVTRGRYREDLDQTKYAHFPQRASGSTYVHVEPVIAPGHYRLKQQMALTTALTKDLEIASEEVEFWQEKYEEAMKTVRSMKRHLPPDWESNSDVETEEDCPYSPPRKMASRAPPPYIIPDED